MSKNSAREIAKTEGKGGWAAEIRQLAIGAELHGVVFRISDKQTIRAKSGKSFSRVMLSDRTGVIAGKNFQSHPLLSDTDAHFIRVWGRLDAYKGELEIAIDSYELLDVSRVDVTDFEATSPFSIHALSGRLTQAIALLTPPLATITATVILEVNEAYHNNPAGKSKHHAYRHGLLEHTLEVMDLALGMAEVRNGIRAAHGQRSLDLDLLRAGALLHDVAKSVELAPVAGGWDYGVEGNLLGHVFMGASLVGRIAHRLGLADDRRVLLLQHLILAHHGEMQYGAVVEGAVEEARLLHLADLASASGNMWAVSEDQAGDFAWADKSGGGRQKVVTRHFFNVNG